MSRSLSRLSCMAACVAAFLPTSLIAGNAGSTKYVVLKITDHEGKTRHMAVNEKEQDSTKKKLDEKYQETKKAFEDAKKATKGPGNKLALPEPQKPRVQVVKRDIKTFNEAQQVVLELDRKLAKEKNGKNGKNVTGK